MSFPIQKGGFLQLCYIVDQRVHLTLSLVEMAIEGERERERESATFSCKTGLHRRVFICGMTVYQVYISILIVLICAP